MEPHDFVFRAALDVRVDRCRGVFRTRPFLWDFTKPLRSKTSRCCANDGKAILKGFANSLTGAGPRLRRFQHRAPRGIRQALEYQIELRRLVRHLP